MRLTFLFVVGLHLLFAGCGGPIWFKKSIIEKLNNPVEVVGRDGASLLLKNGERAALVGVDELLPDSQTPYLNVAIAHGVERTSGRVVGLIPLHHWCGNDPIGKHLIRIDLANLVAYTCESRATSREMNRHDSGNLSEYGWRVGSYMAFKHWEDSK